MPRLSYIELSMTNVLFVNCAKKTNSLVFTDLTEIDTSINYD